MGMSIWLDVSYFDPNDTIDHNEFVTLDYCGMCRYEIIHKCLEEHPEWFLKSQKVADRHIDKVTKYVSERSETERCLVLDTYVTDEGTQETAFCICKRHFKDFNFKWD